MMGCDCPCPPSSHAPREQFGEAICLTPGCDCDGDRADVAAQNVRRVIRMSPIALRLYEIVNATLDNDAASQLVVTAVLSNFEVTDR